MKIAVIIGSPRKESFTKIYCNHAADYAEDKDHEVKVIDLAKEILDPFKGYEETYSDKTKSVVESLNNFDILILGSPIYNGMPSAALKNLFEHVNYKAIERKIAGLIINAGGTISYLQVQAQLTGLMAYFNVTTNPKAVHTSPDDYDEETGDIKEEVRKRIEQLIDRTIEMASTNHKEPEAKTESSD